MRSYPSGASVLSCGLCGTDIHVTLPDDRRYPEVIATEAELACRAHMSARHPARFALWRRVGWRWLIAGLAS